jgi:protease-4
MMRPAHSAKFRRPCLYDEFLHRVGEGRKKSGGGCRQDRAGRVWAGVDAQRIGLVDHLGGLKDATDAAAKLAELGSNYEVDYIESELSLREELLMQLRSEFGQGLGRLAAFFAPQSGIERALDPLVERAREIAELNDPRGLYAYCWCEQPSGRDRVLAVR